MSYRGIDYGKIFSHRINSTIDEILEYHSLIEISLMDEVKKVNSKYIDLKESGEIDPTSEYYHVLEDIFSEEHQKFSENFPHNLRASLLTQTYSLLEYHLNKICEFIEYSHKVSFGIKDINGSGIDRSKLYLSKTNNINIGDYSPEWEFFKRIQKLRNVIIHVYGEFSGANKSIVNIVQDDASLSVQRHESDFKDDSINEAKSYELLIKDDDLNKRFLENIKTFFKKLSEDITWIKE